MGIRLGNVLIKHSKRGEMMMSKIDTDVIKELVYCLIGDIQPTGDTAIDNERSKNLDLYIELLGLIAVDVYRIALEKDDHRHSVQEIGNKTFKYLENERTLFSEWFETEK